MRTRGRSGLILCLLALLGVVIAPGRAFAYEYEAPAVPGEEAFTGNIIETIAEFDSPGGYYQGETGGKLYITVIGESTKDTAKSATVRISCGEDWDIRFDGNLQSNAISADVGSHPAQNVKYLDMEDHEVQPSQAHFVTFAMGPLGKGQRATYVIPIKCEGGPTEATSMEARSLDLSLKGIRESNSMSSISVNTTISTIIHFKTDGVCQKGGTHVLTRDPKTSVAASCKSGTFAFDRYICSKCNKYIFDMPLRALPHSFERPNGTNDTSQERCSVCNIQNPVYSDAAQTDRFEVTEIKSKPDKIAPGEVSIVDVKVKNLWPYAVRDFSFKIDLPSSLELSVVPGILDSATTDVLVGSTATTGTSYESTSSSITVTSEIFGPRNDASQNKTGSVTVKFGVKATGKVSSTDMTMIFNGQDCKTQTEVASPVVVEGAYDPSTCSHVWDSGTLTLAPKCETKGEMTYRCTRCGDTRKSPVDAKGHVPAPADISGNINCSVCGKRLSGSAGAYHTPRWRYEKNPEPTCQAAGRQRKYCIYPGCDLPEHKETWTDLPAVSHKKASTYEKVDEVKPTCEKDGSYKLVWKCVYGCNTVMAEETHIVSATGHKVLPGEDKCSVCQKPVSEFSEKTHEHTFTKWKQTKAPSCKELGQEESTCDFEGCEVKSTRSVSMIPHTFQNGKCSVCGLTQPTNPSQEDVLPEMDISITPVSREASRNEVLTYEVKVAEVAGADPERTYVTVEPSAGMSLVTNSVDVKGSATVVSIQGDASGYDVCLDDINGVVSVAFSARVDDDASEEESLSAKTDSLAPDATDAKTSSVVAVKDGNEEPASGGDAASAFVALVMEPGIVPELSQGDTASFDLDITNTVAGSKTGPLNITVTLPEGLSFGGVQGMQQQMTNVPSDITKSMKIDGQTLNISLSDLPFGSHPRAQIVVTPSSSVDTSKTDFVIKVAGTAETGEVATTEATIKAIKASASTDKPTDPNNPANPDNPDNPSKPDGPNNTEKVDKTALGRGIDAAKDLVESDYTPESWKGLQEALASAEKVYADDQATQTQVNTAARELADAVMALVSVTGNGGTTAPLKLAMTPMEKTVSPGEEVVFHVTVATMGETMSAPFVLEFKATSPLSIVDSEVVDASYEIEPTKGANGSWSFDPMLPNNVCDVDVTCSLPKEANVKDGDTLSFTADLIGVGGTSLTDPVTESVEVSVPSDGSDVVSGNEDSSGNGSSDQTDSSGSGSSGSNGSSGSSGSPSGTSSSGSSYVNPGTLGANNVGNGTTTTSSSPVTSKVASKLPDTGMLPIALLCVGVAAVSGIALGVRRIRGKMG